MWPWEKWQGVKRRGWERPDGVLASNIGQKQSRWVEAENRVAGLVLVASLLLLGQSKLRS